MQAWLALVAWRDGKPAQKINVTSTNIHIDATQVESARLVARELSRMLAPQSLLESQAPLEGDAKMGAQESYNGEVSPNAESFEQAQTMLSGSQGGERVER
jgi:hypothetical protein